MDLAEQQPRPLDGDAFGGRGQAFNGRRIDWTPKDVLAGILCFIALFIIIPIPISIPFAVAYGSESDGFYATLLIVGAASQVGIAVVALYYVTRRSRGGIERLGIVKPDWSTLGWAAAAFGGAFAVSLAYGLAVQLFGLDFLESERDDQIPQQILDNDTLFVLAGIAAVGFAPICEELFFRSFVAPGLARGWGPVLGIVASAALWSSAHLTINIYKTFLPILLIGVVFAYVYFRSGNILSTILAHLAFNTIAFVGLALSE